MIIPQEVYNEVVRRGKRQGYLEAKGVERAIEERWITVHKVKRARELQSFKESGLYIDSHTLIRVKQNIRDRSAKRK